MKKDKEWLKNEVKSLFDKAYDLGKMEYHESEESTHRINSLIDQLDEPETLSQEWIDENKVARIDNLRKMTTSDVVPVEKLKNLLVPKQDKPVIPQFVADWIERQKQPDWDYENKEDALADSIHFTLYSLEANYPETNPDVVLRKPVNEWLDDDRKNYWKLIDGVRYGYEVEKEKLYTVDLPPFYELIKRLDKNTYELKRYSESGLGDYTNAFTEQEIKDYDERFWAFAEEVTE